MNPRSLSSSIALLATAVLTSAPAAAQTWVGMRTTPRLTEIVAIDKTGEAGWLYGAEDVAGDGLANFKQPEQSVDLRTGYAVTDASRFWARVYVSDPNAVGGNIKAFVFVDADRTVATGGPAAAPEIDAKLTTDPSPGGYDFVLELRGNGTVGAVWAWSVPMQQFTAVVPKATEAVGETGKDTDPILITGAAHGYLQGSVDLALVGLTQACAANLFFRSVNTTPGGASDLDVGGVASCVPADANSDGVPDPVVPPTGCTADNQCPAGGICAHGKCVLAPPCVVEPDCKPTEVCPHKGICAPKGGGTCTSKPLGTASFRPGEMPPPDRPGGPQVGERASLSGPNGRFLSQYHREQGSPLGGGDPP